MLTCVELANTGCNCYGCCMDSLPPPLAPPLMPSPTNPPPASVAALTTTGDGVEICGDVVVDVTLAADVGYVLSCAVFVRSGATLRIQAGSTIDVAAEQLPPFGAVDADGSGMVTATELVAFFERRGVMRPALSSLFASLDADGSDDVSVGEWTSLASAAAAVNVREVISGVPLVIERGARLLAVGRADDPISFESLAKPSWMSSSTPWW